VFTELSALVTPPEEETVDPAVRDAALAVIAVASVTDSVDPSAEDLEIFLGRVDALLAECAKATE
jgi:hypothetical protein